MSQAIFTVQQSAKPIIARTTFPISAGNIFIPISAPTAKIIRISGMLRMSAGLSFSIAAAFRFENTGLSSFNQVGIRNDWNGAPSISVADSAGASNIGGLIVAGTDAPASIFSTFEIIVNNWDLTNPHYGEIITSFPTNALLNGRVEKHSFYDLNSVTYNGLFINWGGKTPVTNCYYQIDQLA